MDRQRGGSPKPWRARLPIEGFGDWAFSGTMLILTLIVVLLACISVRSLVSWHAAWERVVNGIGLYWLVIVGMALAGALYSCVLQARGVRASRDKTSAADRDRGLALRFGGAALSAVSFGLSLVVFRLAQSKVGGAAEIGTPDRGIGFFDMITWLGTFATLAVVISTALVAIWVKRREDEAQHSAAVVQMRQAWINKVRATMAGLLAAGQALRADHEGRQSNPVRGREARLLMREANLLLNPTEGHHAVLLAAVKSWLHHAGIEDHLRSQDSHPKPQEVQSDFDAATDWLVLLTQLVLKVEWAVTSVGRERVGEKAGALWEQVRAYEGKHDPELRRIAPQALDVRMSRASALMDGEDTPSQANLVTAPLKSMDSGVPA